MGVEPDIVVPAGQVLDVAHCRALENLVACTTDEKEKTWFVWHLERIREAGYVNDISTKMLEQFIGDYGSYEITLSEESLCFSRGGRMKHRLIPVSETKFIVEDLDYLNFEFVKGKAGVTGVKIDLDYGRQIEYERNKE